MKHSKELFTPVAEKQQICKSGCPDEGSQEQKEMKICKFGGRMGCFKYFENTTRPNINFAMRS